MSQIKFGRLRTGEIIGPYWTNFTSLKKRLRIDDVQFLKLDYSTDSKINWKDTEIFHRWNNKNLTKISVRICNFVESFLKLAKESISYCEVRLPLIETGTTVFTFDQHSMETSGSFTERFFKLAFLCNIQNFSILSNGKITNFRENYTENLSQLVVEIPQRNDEKGQLILPNGLDQALLKSSIFSKFYSNNLFIKNPPI